MNIVMNVLIQAIRCPFKYQLHSLPFASHWGEDIQYMFEENTKQTDNFTVNVSL